MNPVSEGVRIDSGPAVERRRADARLEALDTLSRLDDPVAKAIERAVEQATTVRIDEPLMARFTERYGNLPTPAGMSDSEWCVRMVLAAAGFEVLP